MAGVLVFISLLFILCQSAKIVPDLYEVIYCRWGAEEDDCPITAFIERVVSFSHFLLAFNSSVNFVIYTWRGTYLAVCIDIPKYRRELRTHSYKVLPFVL